MFRDSNGFELISEWVYRAVELVATLALTAVLGLLGLFIPGCWEAASRLWRDDD